MALDVEVVRLGAADDDLVDEVVVTTARAFWPDPLFGYFARNHVHHHGFVPSVLRPVIADARGHGEVWVARTQRGVAGSASWIAPGMMPRSKGRDLRIARGALGAFARGRNRADALRLLGAVDRRHPHEPHWYLALLGVDPRFQRQGVGQALVRPVLDRCDEEGLPAYLETQKEENLAFYGRFGFSELHRVERRGGPPIWLLWRVPGAAG